MYFQFKSCYVCSKVIGFSPFTIRARKLFHKQCGAKIVILECGHAFKKGNFLQRLNINPNHTLKPELFLAELSR